MSSARPARVIIALSAGAAEAGAAVSAAGVPTPGVTPDNRFVISSSENPSNGSKFEDEVITASPRLERFFARPIGVRCTNLRVPLSGSLILTLVIDHMYNSLYKWSI